MMPRTIARGDIPRFIMLSVLFLPLKVVWYTAVGAGAIAWFPVNYLIYGWSRTKCAYWHLAWWGKRRPIVTERSDRWELTEECPICGIKRRYKVIEVGAGDL